MLSSITKQFIDYLKRSGDSKILTENLTQNEQGFVSYTITKDNVFVINQCYGSGKYWDDYCANKAKELHCSKIRFATKRNYKGFEKKYKYNMIGYILEKEVK